MPDNTTETLGLDATTAAARSAAVMPAILAILLGVFLVFGTGMVQISAAHNAAHDTRHALGFPCH